jgi:hypothetical protein
MLAGATPLTTAESPEVRDAFAGQRAAVANIQDHERDWSALVNLVDAALWADPGSEPALRTQLRDLANRSRAPHLLTYSCYYDGSAALLVSPPGFGAALPLFERGLEIARAAGDPRHEGIMLRAIAVVATGLGGLDALDRCHEALDALYEVRYWQKIWQTLDCVALALAKTDHVDGAAIILGYLDAHMPACGLEYWLDFRAQTRALVDAAGDHEAAAQRGSRLSRDELVASALELCRSTRRI